MVDVAKLFIPDRFDALRKESPDALLTMIDPVERALEVIDDRFADMAAAGRGSLLLLQGVPGIGKTTFLETVHLFREDVETVRLPRTSDVESALAELPSTTASRIVVIEGREALGQVSEVEVEAWIHAINAFVRSPEGETSLVVWPVNKVELSQLLHRVGVDVGDDALFGNQEPFYEFTGLASSEFPRVANRTVEALNDGTSLTALGISEAHAAELANESATLGKYLGKIRGAAIRAQATVTALVAKEQYRVWTVVISGSDSEGDAAALTRGSAAFADIDRIMKSTNANVVEDIQQQPALIGILGTTFDARIMHLDMVTVLAIAREYGSPALHSKMSAQGMATTQKDNARQRITDSELGLLLAGEDLGLRRQGKKPGDNTKLAFGKLALIAQDNDGLLNDSIGRALVDAGLATAYTTESKLGAKYTYYSDLLLETPAGPVRIEVMWRTKSSRAQVANYVLGKLKQYGKAIGLFKAGA